MSFLLNVSREKLFCACAVLGKIALFRRNTVFVVGSIIHHYPTGPWEDSASYAQDGACDITLMASIMQFLPPYIKML